MSDELQELQEHAEHAQHHPDLAPVSLTMALLAVAVAIVTLLGHRAHTEEVVQQAKASDQWAYYQSKNIRENTDQVLADFAVANNKDQGDVAKFHEKYAAEAEKQHKEKGEIQDKAKELEGEVASERHRADRYDLAEVFLEIGLVVTSITLLSGKKIFWYAGMVFAVLGIVVAAMGVLAH
jgi:hypothetical protein